MKKLFISQPMNGKTDEEILEVRKIAIERAEKLLGEPMEVIDSFFQFDAPDNVNSGMWFLGKSLELLAAADVVYFAKGWEKARGCLIESECAFRYGTENVIRE